MKNNIKIEVSYEKENGNKLTIFGITKTDSELEIDLSTLVKRKEDKEIKEAMQLLHYILSGYISQEWIEKFNERNGIEIE